MGELDGVFHFALRHSEDSKEDLQGRAKNRKGTSVIDEMLQKTKELNAEDRVSTIAKSLIQGQIPC